MPFLAKTFIYNNIPSEVHNLYLGDVDGEGEISAAGSNSVSLLTQKLFRRPIPLFFGAEQTPCLQFPISAYCPDDLDAPNYSDVSSWLFGQQQYGILRICQNDMLEIYYRCFLINPQITRIGNFIRAFTTTVLCNSPFAWAEPITETHTYNPNAYSITDNITFLNRSANVFYTFPTNVTIVGNIFGGSVSITNISDVNRQFIYILAPNETIVFNCDLQIITSNLVTYPLVNFNKNFLRFVQGINNLIVTGNISSLSISYDVAVKIGG